MTTQEARGAATGPSLARALPLRDLLDTPVLSGARVIAGHTGVDRLVERLNVMEVPDILPWVKPRELLLTTAYPLRDQIDELPRLVRTLDAAGLAGLGVKLGRYVDELPAEVLAAADACGFPIVLLPSSASFDEILNQVLATILNRQATLLARSEGIHRAFLDLVLAGGGLDAIAAQLAETTGATAAILDTDRSILARAGDDGRLETALEIRGGELLQGDERVGTSVTVSAGARVYGHVVAFVDTPDARLALETAATVTALEIVKRNELQAVEAKYQSDLMYDLLVGRVRDRDDALARAATFGWQLDRRIICLVVQLDDPVGTVVPDEERRRPPLAAAIHGRIVQRDPGAAVVRFSNEVVVLTAAFDGDDGRARAKAFMRDLIRQTAATIRAETSAGMGRPVTDVQDIPVAYQQAVKALTIGRQVDGRGTVAHFDDLGAYRLLSLVPDPDELRSFADETLGVLTGDDETAADLRHTLEVLLEANGNVAEAARRLHFHYNTLRYRIEKLERIVGPFTLDATTRLDVHLALLVHRMHAISV
jgi:purine catabolism regulator